MKKIYSLILLFSCIQTAVHAQWAAVNNGVDNYVWGSAVYNNELYVSGNFENADGNQALGIAKWNGSAWSAVGGGFQTNAFSYVVRGLIVYNNELIAGGYVDSAGGMAIHKVARWNGSSWSAMGTNCPISTINCFAIHNGELYAGGQAGGAVKVCVAKWNGSGWTGLDTETADHNVWSLASYNGELYAGGSYTSFNGLTTAHLVKYNGSSWSAVNTGFGMFDIIRAMAVFNGKLYIGGGFTSVGGVSASNIASYDGSTWSALQGGVNSTVQSLLPYGTQLFVGGAYWSVNGVTANRAASWNGSAWTVLGTDLGAGAKTICVYNNELYYGGEGAFNGQNYVARWNGGTFTGIEKAVTQNGYTIYPNPASARVTISGISKATDIEITDITGRPLRFLYTKPEEGTLQLDVAEWKKGMYLIRDLHSAGQVQKLIVE
ncbi:MAG: T9SS type A sorting domain-containing protein [Bacteroidia bacterium]